MMDKIHMFNDMASKLQISEKLEISYTIYFLLTLILGVG